MALSFRPFSSTGFVSVFQFNGSNWLQIGGAIAGEGFNDSFGVSHALSFDGSILAIGAHKNDGVNGIDSGHVRVFENMDDVWNQIGQDIDGEAPGGNIGYDAHFGGAIGGNKQRI